MSDEYKYWIGLGSNLGDRLANLQFALQQLRNSCTVNAMSSAWETSPVGKVDQPAFLNAVAAITTLLPPPEMLQRALAIERSAGRDRGHEQPKGPRTLDLDLLLAECNGVAVITSAPGLALPHPSMHQRRFVLAPLAEVAPATQHPIAAKDVAQLLRELPCDGANGFNSVKKFNSLK